MTDFNTPELAGFDLPHDVDSGDAAQVPQAKPAQAAKPVGPNPFTALAGLFSERAGIFDIGLEGKMLAAAFASACRSRRVRSLPAA
mgnify:CR=1 FL=1